MADPKRDRALNLIRTMQDLVDRPTTPQGEKDAAKSRIAALRAKHNITEPVKATWNAKGTTYRPPNNYDQRKAESDAMEAARRKRAAADEVRRQTDRRRAAATEAAREAAHRQMAQYAYQKKMRDKDAMGRPLSDAEKREAQRDPLGWAAKRDKRTQAQRNEDIGQAWGQAGREADKTAKAFRDLADQARKAKTATTATWDTATKYNAKIWDVKETTSKAGNPMVMIEFMLNNAKTVRGYYVLNNERGLKNLMAIVSTLLGAVATQMSVDQILKALHGKACTIILNTWTTDQGIENWGVQTVMKPWA